jgi:glycosyltransferase involved in cell wall biosynthesis
MTVPRLSVIVPTVGRPELARTLESIRLQADRDLVEVVVVGDSHAGTHAARLPWARQLARKYGARYAEHDGGKHMVGQAQRQYGMGLATGEWLAFMADDDLYRDGALARMIAAGEWHGSERPLLFRVQMNHIGLHIWHFKGLLRLGNVDAECIMVPNVPDKLGRWGDRYEGDYDFICETVVLFGDATWIDETIAIARPEPDEVWCA